MNPFRVLGISPAASETEIKRAYARKLKTTRPDEDPEGFQRLNEAYRSALDRCRVLSERPLAGRSVDLEVERPPIDVTAAKIRSPEPPRRTAEVRPIELETSANSEGETRPHPAEPFRIDRFLGELEQVAVRGTPAELRIWLDGRPELYDLGLKAEVGRHVQDALEEGGLQPLLEGYLQPLGDFFGFEPPIWLAERLEAQRAIASDSTSRYGEAKVWPIRQLKRQFRWPRSLLVATWPRASARIVRLGNQLSSAHGQWPSELELDQYRFFAQLVDRDYFGRWRWALAGARSVMWALFLTPLWFLPALLELSLLEALGLTVLSAVMTAVFVAAVQALFLGIRFLARLNRRRRDRGQSHVKHGPVWFGFAALVLSVIPESGRELAWLPAAIGGLLHANRLFQVVRFWAAVSWAGALLRRELTGGEPIPDLLVGLALAPMFMLTFDALYARIHRIPLRDAVGNNLTQLASYVLLAGAISASILVR